MKDSLSAVEGERPVGIRVPPLESVLVRVIAAVQASGGLLGAIFGLYLLAMPGVPSSSAFLIVWTSVLATVAGVRLWRNNSGGLELSVLMQFAQTLEVMRPFAYECRFGLALNLVVSKTGVYVAPKLGAAVFTGPARDATIDIFALNMVAIASFAYLVYVWKKTGGTLTRETAQPQ